MIRVRYVVNTVKTEENVLSEAVFRFHIIRREKAELSDWRY